MLWGRHGCPKPPSSCTLPPVPLTSLLHWASPSVLPLSLASTAGKVVSPYQRAIMFVDNAGADVVLGMIPFARELLRMGAEVRGWG